MLTGGSGSFGNSFTEFALSNNLFEKIIIYSRCEFKQDLMKKKFNDERLRFFIGDVRDQERLYQATKNVDYVIHAAALKRVDSVNYNPFEAVKTNIIGSQNVINACIDNNVEKVLALTTDKCVQPNNLYGATKLVAEKLFLNSYVYQQQYNIKMSAVRYGNIAGSRGSIIPYFKELVAKGEKVLPITHEKMTRFYFDLKDAIRFVYDRLCDMQGREVFIPKLKSFRIIDLIKAFDCDYKIVGMQQDEKLSEIMINPYENYIEYDNYYIIRSDCKKSGLLYDCADNEFMSIAELKQKIKNIII